MRDGDDPLVGGDVGQRLGGQQVADGVAPEVAARQVPELGPGAALR